MNNLYSDDDDNFGNEMDIFDDEFNEEDILNQIDNQKMENV